MLSGSSHGTLPHLSVPRVWFKFFQFTFRYRREREKPPGLFPSKSAFRGYIEPLSRATRPTMFCELWLQLAKEFDILGHNVSISVGVGHGIMGRDGIAAETGREGRTSMHGDQSCFAGLDLAEAKSERNMERQEREWERKRKRGMCIHVADGLAIDLKRGSILIASARGNAINGIRGTVWQWSRYYILGSKSVTRALYIYISRCDR